MANKKNWFVSINNGCVYFWFEDDKNNGPAENVPSHPADPHLPEAAKVLGVRPGHVALARGRVRARRPLAGVRVLRNRVHRTAHAARAQVLVAGPSSRKVQHALSGEQLGEWARPQVQVHHGALFHSHQSHQRRLRQRLAQHQLREDLLDLFHAARMYNQSLYYY